MDEVYLVVFSEPGVGSNTMEVPLETLIALFAMSYIKCDPSCIKFVMQPKGEDEVPFKVKIPDHSSNIIVESQVPITIQDCVLPAVLVSSPIGYVCIAGLSAVLRQIVKAARISDPTVGSLLGFREGCLSACAEASLWTRFCEVDVPKATKEYIFRLESPVDCELILPADIARFEKHLQQPVRVHNIQKRRQDYAKSIALSLRRDSSSSISIEMANLNIKDEAKELEHTFAEGHCLTLADVILFPCMYIIFSLAKEMQLDHHVPLVKEWLDRMMCLKNVKESSEIICNESLPVNSYSVCSLPDVPTQSLYKSDPKRYKPRTRIFTKQDEVDASLKLVSQMGLNLAWSAKPFGADIEFDWSSVPPDAHPLGGSLPLSRSDRKTQQLENLVKAVLKVAKPGDKIVDFCSGSGHLGILLAHFLPSCGIILLDNKDESLRRARDRVNRLAQSNVTVYQCNLDYFRGKFDIGVSLHACGVATDLVIQRCLSQGAAFICCPCCYGGVNDNHVVSYPRSKLFKNSRITMREYLVLGHSADQTHDEGNSKTEQGKQCMGIIDMDRCMQAKENGYNVFLSKLKPETCTPKNNLLVGLPGK